MLSYFASLTYVSFPGGNVRKAGITSVQLLASDIGGVRATGGVSKEDGKRHLLRVEEKTPIHNNKSIFDHFFFFFCSPLLMTALA